MCYFLIITAAVLKYNVSWTFNLDPKNKIMKIVTSIPIHMSTIEDELVSANNYAYIAE